MIQLAFALAILVHASPPPQTLVVHLKAQKALVLASPEGQLRLFTCPLPRSIAVDFGFDSPDALARCRKSSAFGEDTPENRAVFVDHFVEQIRDWRGFAWRVRRHSERARFYATLGGLATIPSYLGSRAIFKRFGWPSVGTHQSVQTTLVLLGSQSAGLIIASGMVSGFAQREYRQIERDLGPIDFSTGPILLNADSTFFDLLKVSAYQAGARTMAPARAK